MTKKNSFFEIAVITIKLIIICSVIALLVAGVNHITKDKILENEALKTKIAVISLFADNTAGVIDESNIVSFDIKYEDITDKCGELLSGVKAVYVVTDSLNEVIGYCASCSPMGFKDYINFIVSVDNSCKITGIQFVSMQETSGIGTKIKDPGFISGFIGLDSDISSNVDVISGATKSSKPTIEAVENGLLQIKNYIKEAK